MDSWSLHILSKPSFLWWIALAAAVALGVWTYYRLRAPVSSRWLALLRSLRIGAMILVLAALLEPVLNMVGSRTGPAPLLFLADASGSMELPEAVSAESDSATRWERARALMDEAARRWGSDFDLHLASFSGHLRLHPRADSLPSTPAGPSALGEALEQALTSPALGALSGVVLLSDGVNTSGKDPLLIARNSPVPVYTICLGDTLPANDLLVRQVQTNPEVTLGEPLPMQVTLEAWGRKGQEVLVEILDGEGVVASERVRLSGEKGEAQDVRLEVKPRRAGLVAYRVRARVASDDDPIPINNERIVAVDVREKARRVLVIEPEPSWDFTFLRRTLQADSSLVATFVVRDLVDRWKVLGDPVVPGIPQTLEQWRQFSAVVISGSGEIGTQETNVRRFVEDGGGLFFLHGAGGWRELLRGDLGKLLPVNPLARQIARQGPLSVELTDAGQVDPLMLVTDSPFRNATLWAGLPPIWTGDQKFATKAGATALLRWSGLGEPAFAVAPFGKGRVAAFCGHGFWRWVFLPKSVAGSAEVAEPFLRQTVRWLMEPSTQDRFRVVAVRKVFQNGEGLEFEANYRNEAYEPLVGARTELTVTRDDVPEQAGDEIGEAPGPEAWAGRAARRVEMIPTGRQGEYHARLEPLPPGAYRYEAHITGPNGEKETREGRFWVEATGVETYRTWSDRRTLNRISEVSGGEMAQGTDLSSLRPVVQRTHRKTQEVRQAELWNHWVLFAAFVALLGIEWFVRRRRGLA